MTSTSQEEELKRLEALEIELSGSEDLEVVGKNATKQMLLNLALDRLEEARFLWRRTRPQVREIAPDLRRAWQVGTCLWLRSDIPGASSLLANEAEWSQTFWPVVTSVLDKVRQREVILIGRAYSTIELSEVAKRLAFTEKEALDYCHQREWSFDSNDAIIFPRSVIDLEDSAKGFDKLKHLADIMTQLST